MVAGIGNPIVALSALPVPWSVIVGILLVKKMAIDAMSPSGINGLPALATQDIFTARHRLQMSKVSAGAIAAKMVKLQPFRNRSNEMLIKKSMDEAILVHPFDVSI